MSQIGEQNDEEVHRIVYDTQNFNYPAYVTEVAADSPAGRGGLQTDDFIVHIGDTTFDENHSFINLLFAHQPGETVPVEVVRNGQSVELQITLGETSANQ